MENNWIVGSDISEEGRKVLETILKKRGVYDLIKSGSTYGLKKYLKPSIGYLHNPNEIPNVIDAAKKIVTAVEKNKKICVFGHDDVDGITSTYILLQCLNDLGSHDHEYYIPNRKFDKFGLNDDFIDRMIDKKFDLVITVDIGIGENEAIGILKSHSIETIIIDHHRISKKLPPAISIVNPKMKGLDFLGSILAGVGVTYKVVQVISNLSGNSSTKFDLILCGLGTIADRVPLLDDNRIFAAYLYQNFDHTENMFFIFFIQDNIGLSPEKIIMRMIKFLTAGRGREGRHFGLDALLSKKISEVKEIYEKIQAILLSAEQESSRVKKILAAEYEKNKEEAIFFYYDEKGKLPVEYIGLGGSFIADKYKKPALILSPLNREIINAESRGPDNFDWIECFQKIKSNLIQFGGHKQAAGFTCSPDQVNEIKKDIKKIAVEYQLYANRSSNSEIEKKLAFDVMLEKENMDKKILFEVSRKIFPFGEKNQKPKFLIKKISESHLEKMGFDDLPNNSEELIDVIISTGEEVVKRKIKK